MIALNKTQDFLMAHLGALQEPASTAMMLSAYSAACEAWDDYIPSLAKFDGMPLDDYPQGAKFYSMLLLTFCKGDFAQEYLAFAGMKLSIAVWKESGLSVNDFCLLFDGATVREKLGAFLASVEENEYD